MTRAAAIVTAAAHALPRAASTTSEQITAETVVTPRSHRVENWGTRGKRSGLRSFIPSNVAVSCLFFKGWELAGHVEPRSLKTAGIRSFGLNQPS